MVEYIESPRPFRYPHIYLDIYRTLITPAYEGMELIEAMECYAREYTGFRRRKSIDHSTLP
jgi:hypothetical protein